MDLNSFKSFLGWCTVINMSFLLYWFVMLAFFHDVVYRLHSRWFKISRETFDALHYGAMAFYKLGTLLFNLVPYFALLIIL